MKADDGHMTGVEGASADGITSADQVLFLTTFSRIGNKTHHCQTLPVTSKITENSCIRNF
jgi:hypothetical protein